MEKKKFCSFDDYIIIIIIITIKASFIEREQVIFTKNKVILWDCSLAS